MSQYEDIAPTVRHIEKLAQKLILAITALNARLDAQVTASTDADADYAAEVADAQTVLQGEIDALSESRMEGLLNISDEAETRRRAMTEETERRTTEDGNLQRQINSLAESVLGILAIISENRERGE